MGKRAAKAQSVEHPCNTCHVPDAVPSLTPSSTHVHLTDKDDATPEFGTKVAQQGSENNQICSLSLSLGGAETVPRAPSSPYPDHKDHMDSRLSPLIHSPCLCIPQHLCLPEIAAEAQ